MAWIKSKIRNNDGAVSIYNDETPPDLGRNITIAPEVKPKRGSGFMHVDDYSDQLADKLVKFLNDNGA